MQALCKTRVAAGLELMDMAVPAPMSDDEMLMRLSAADICGSDLHVHDWHFSYEFMAPSLRVTIGHEYLALLGESIPASRSTLPALRNLSSGTAVCTSAICRKRQMHCSCRCL